MSKKTHNTCTEDQSAQLPPCRGAFFPKSAGSFLSETRVDAHDRAPRRTYVTLTQPRPTLFLACADTAVVRIACFVHTLVRVNTSFTPDPRNGPAERNVEPGRPGGPLRPGSARFHQAENKLIAAPIRAQSSHCLNLIQY